MYLNGKSSFQEHKNQVNFSRMVLGVEDGSGKLFKKSIFENDAAEFCLVQLRCTIVV